MSKSRQQKVKNGKRRIERRLRRKNWSQQDEPMFKANNIHYELSERTRGIGVGGIGAVHKLALASGLVEAIDEKVDVLKVHLPYHESDHVLNIAYNILSGGTCLEDIELLRNDEVYLDGLGAQRIPDPTTAGDFCRRLEEKDINRLMEAFNEVRRRMWSQQPEEFFDEAKIEVSSGVSAPPPISSPGAKPGSLLPTRWGRALQWWRLSGAFSFGTSSKARRARPRCTWRRCSFFTPAPSPSSPTPFRR